MAGRRTLAEKVWDQHVVVRGEGEGSAREPDLIYIDLHLVHEVTSPQAFDGLRLAGRSLRRPDLTIATEDHNVPTIDIDKPIADPGLAHAGRDAASQLRGVRRPAASDGRSRSGHRARGRARSSGLTQPGMTVVCGDSHTSTHGAFGALAMGIGTSEVEHVMATQTLSLRPFKTMAITVDGELQPGVTSKDLILAVIAKIGTGGGQGYVLEYRGEAIRKLSMEARMTICNMSIEAGARAGMIAPDETTYEFIKGRPHAPKGADWDAAVAAWEQLKTDDDAVFDAEVRIDAQCADPVRHVGHQPGTGRTARRLGAGSGGDRRRERAVCCREGAARTWTSTPERRCGRSPSTPSSSVPAPTAGSRICVPSPTCSTGRKVADGVRMLVVPGFDACSCTGRGGRSRRDLHRRRGGMASGRLLDVPGHEPGSARPG